MWSPPGGMLGLALGYFFWYTLFAALAKALSSGLVPGVDEEVGGLVLLPAAALGFLAGALLFLSLSGWWGYMEPKPALGRTLGLPGRSMIGAGFFMAVIVATTILNYTFVGVSILFMLLMMRAGVLGLSPVNDAVWGRKVHGYSWAALGFCLLAVATALGDVDGYPLTFAAILSLCAYFLGYIGRFQIMSRTAKTGEDHVDRHYFADENISSALWLVLLCAALALLGVGEWGQSLREGVSANFLFSDAALFAVGIGLLYQALYVFGTLIYLDPREYSWCVPANRSASVFSAIAASFGLAWLAGVPAPGIPQLVAAFFVLLAVAALCYPQLRDLVRRIPEPVPSGRPLVLFVCGANRGRSPIAAALAQAELSGVDPADAWSVACAGVNVREPGAAMAPAAVAALRELGVTETAHAAQPLTPELCERSAVIYCMTSEQRSAVTAMAPGVAGRTRRLDPDGDLSEPPADSQDSWNGFAVRVRELVRQRLAEFPTPALATSTG